MTTLTDISSTAAKPASEEGAVCHTRQAVADISSAVKADAQELRYLAEDYVIEHPLRVVGLGIGLGFLLGVIWTR
ncbi:glycine zipper domain-containing protein [Humisphaera borealis]|uniref:DUF883 family protein n=1 Tax=Humisphaera borealis TaxID=2807512 RepID=A0A7M2WT47_9BACT|nr:DUF883 family protein [Humisphaera borealis]QOV87991.1 DUF883 family protein [Humisphaera borealis]